MLRCWVVCSVILIQLPRCFSQQDAASVLQNLTSNRRQHRRTVDGRLCAAAFVQDDQTYTDCTTARAPNGALGVFEGWLQYSHPPLSISFTFQVGRSGATWRFSYSAKGQQTGIIVYLQSTTVGCFLFVLGDDWNINMIIQTRYVLKQGRRSI